ncbi:NAD(P)-binding protein [Aulographum hederae CBS 113979]|uniref:NAD(P)-binding protein n=1 Tax=Aulographum hederae CBS 113979 TaxID=1176131 RepID=A0A6G1HH04_9PEZI|nr:NAD(P)-binding protein [Aulographum hederae CBS 113979]
MGSSNVVLITGGNTGLGYETVKALYSSSQSYMILMGSRNLEKAEQAINRLKSEAAESASTVTPVQIDIESDESISKAFDKVKSEFGHVDTLINNAGAQFDQQVQAGKMTPREMWNQTWDTNVTSTQLMTEAFVPLLLKSSDPRLLFLTSGLASLTEMSEHRSPRYHHPPAGWPKARDGFLAYRSSKTGMNMVALEWDRLLKNDGVKVFSISPGLLATGFGGDPEFLKKIGAIDPAIGGGVVRGVVEGERDQEVGKTVRIRDVQPW